jgi:hypothetical protein
MITDTMGSVLLRYERPSILGVSHDSDSALLENGKYSSYENDNNKKKKKTPWPLVRERTIPTDRPPLVDEI